LEKDETLGVAYIKRDGKEVYKFSKINTSDTFKYFERLWTNYGRVVPYAEFEEIYTNNHKSRYDEVPPTTVKMHGKIKGSHYFCLRLIVPTNKKK